MTETSKIETSCANKTVLIVDDNAALRGLLRVSLHAFGVAKVYEAESVDLALSLIDCKHVDLIITDWKMKPRDGLDRCKLRRWSLFWMHGGIGDDDGESTCGYLPTGGDPGLRCALRSSRGGERGGGR